MRILMLGLDAAGKTSILFLTVTNFLLDMNVIPHFHLLVLHYMAKRNGSVYRFAAYSLSCQSGIKSLLGRTVLLLCLTPAE